MAAVTYFAVGNTKNAFFLSDATPVARLRAAVFRKDRFPRPTSCNSATRAILRNLFRRPCTTFYGRAGLRFGRAPQGAARPLTRGRARPAPARLRLLWRSRATASRAILLNDRNAVLDAGRVTRHHRRRATSWSRVRIGRCRVRSSPRVRWRCARRCRGARR